VQQGVAKERYLRKLLPPFPMENFTTDIVNQTHTNTKVTIQGKPTEIHLISRYQELFIIKLKTSYRRQNV